MAVMPHNEVAAPGTIAREQKRLLALQLREGGAHYRQIAEQLEVSLGTAHQWVKEAMEELHGQVLEQAGQVKQLELNRLDAMWSALETRKDNNTPRTIETKLKIMERRAKLLGLDAPVQVAGPNGGPIEFQEVTPREELRKKVTAIRVRMNGGESVEVAVAEGVATAEAPPAASSALPEVAG